MILTLKNIGKIAGASVELNGITVIAGENNTGKSTVGKVLFCIFNSFYKIKEKIDEERQDTIEEILAVLDRRLINTSVSRADIGDFSQALLDNREQYIENSDLLQEYIEEWFLKKDETSQLDLKAESLGEFIEPITSILSVSDEEILKTVLQKKLSAEFNSQINNLYSEEEGKIDLKIKETEVGMIIRNNELASIKNNFDLHTEVIYIDDPFVLDNLRSERSQLFLNRNYANHQEHLKQKLRKIDNRSEIKVALNEIITTKKIDVILQKLDSICSGEMVRNRMSFVYQKKNSNVVFNMKNISTGLKTFVILKTLLLNNSLEENGTIVLDEPEIHLHPEWQLLFAELIVLLQKEFNMHILLNTHSPYFLRAIQVYSAKYEIADRCKYYLSENVDERAILKDVTTSIDEIYVKLAKPLESLENGRYCDACFIKNRYISASARNVKRDIAR